MGRQSTFMFTMRGPVVSRLVLSALGHRSNRQGAMLRLVHQSPSKYMYIALSHDEPSMITVRDKPRSSCSKATNRVE